MGGQGFRAWPIVLFLAIEGRSGRLLLYRTRVNIVRHIQHFEFQTQLDVGKHSKHWMEHGQTVFR
jgi:hypothetical protein|uniref:Uncharacterized protein n=1 Tax=Picea sitchensis TaxID=3332 RepID=A0A6B9XUK5_PICSI|nr:hypothetical protein Q903MT_gene3708 [Picea sitchensis]